MAPDWSAYPREVLPRLRPLMVLVRGVLSTPMPVMLSLLRSVLSLLSAARSSEVLSRAPEE